jgi:hypothetical protein
MDLVIFEDNKPFVLEALQNGDFDYMEAASEVFEADFFVSSKPDPFSMSCRRAIPAPQERGCAFLVLCGQQSFHAAARGARF